MREYHVLNLGVLASSRLPFICWLAKASSILTWRSLPTPREESQAVYRHLEHLQSLPGPPILVRTVGRLGDDLQTGRGPTKRFASIPAFTRDEHGRPGIIRRQCTTEYKIEVVEKAIRRDVLGLAFRQRFPRDVIVHQSFGISLDESGRAVRVTRRFAEKQNVTARFPLLDKAWTRSDCVAYLRERLPHPPPRSACVFCPFHSNHEWALLQRTDPAAWDRAVEIDQSLRDGDAVCTRKMRQPMYLHRSCRPLAEIDFNKAPTETIHPMSVGECHGTCGV